MISSSPIGGDGKIYWCSERGKTYVIDATALAAAASILRDLNRGIIGRRSHDPLWYAAIEHRILAEGPQGEDIIKIASSIPTPKFVSKYTAEIKQAFQDMQSPDVAPKSLGWFGRVFGSMRHVAR